MVGYPGTRITGSTGAAWWFKTPAQRKQFADYVQFMAQHFNGRVKYYEIWNEPTETSGGDPRAPIALSDYLEVVSQVAPIIQDIDPTAKIVVGALGRFNPWERDWLKRVLSSETGWLVDAVSWHPFYGESPLNDQARGPRIGRIIRLLYKPSRRRQPAWVLKVNIWLRRWSGALIKTSFHTNHHITRTLKPPSMPRGQSSCTGA